MFKYLKLYLMILFFYFFVGRYTVNTCMDYNKRSIYLYDVIFYISLLSFNILLSCVYKYSQYHLNSKMNEKNYLINQHDMCNDLQKNKNSQLKTIDSAKKIDNVKACMNFYRVNDPFNYNTSNFKYLLSQDDFYKKNHTNNTIKKEEQSIKTKQQMHTSILFKYLSLPSIFSLSDKQNMITSTCIKNKTKNNNISNCFARYASLDRCNSYDSFSSYYTCFSNDVNFNNDYNNNFRSVSCNNLNDYSHYINEIDCINKNTYDSLPNLVCVDNNITYKKKYNSTSLLLGDDRKVVDAIYSSSLENPLKKVEIIDDTNNSIYSSNDSLNNNIFTTPDNCLNISNAKFDSFYSL